MSREQFVATRGNDAPRFLFYSHDGLGLGHIRRNLAIARALTDTAARASIVLATSAEYADTLGLAANVDVCVPGVSPRREQLIRAEAFGRLGLGRTVVPDALSPERLRAEIELALGGPGRARAPCAQRSRLRRPAQSGPQLAASSRTCVPVAAAGCQFEP